MAVQLTHRLLATLTIAIVAVGAASILATYGLMSNSRSIQSYGAVKAVNVGVYWNSGCTNVTSTVNWGMLSPGDLKNVTLYVKNDGNVAVMLSLAAQNWNPSNASNYMGLSWNREGQIVNSGAVTTAILTLSVSSSISGITSFSFDIIITGVEQLT
jgi:hypothetical protein